MKRFFLAIVLWLLPFAAYAQTDAAPVQQGWYSQGRAANLSVSTASANEALPTNGFSAKLCNAGANDAYVGFGADNTAAATVAGSSFIKAGYCATFALKANQGATRAAYVAAITNSSTTTLYVETGAGTPTDGSTLNATVVGTGTFSVQNTAATPAGQNGIGNVGGKTVAVCATPTVTASNAYGTNYVVGGLLTFANAFTSTGSGLLQGVVVTINDNETSGFTFFPFNANPSGTTWTDAAVAAIVAGDVAKVRNPVSLNGNNQLKATVFSVYSAAGLGEALAPGTTSLYGVLIANAALTNNFAGTSDVQVCVKVLDDE